ncbi:bifunctional nuclease family protein [Chlamydia vaughanii]|uniref:bifunctional nuclease family protein n=1 Tax=Chlamydia vaughanii TaxID=3112552 RepID=UPI0032B16CEE
MSIEKELLQDTPLVLLNFYKLVSFCHYAGIVVGTEEKKFAIYGHVSMGQAFHNSDPKHFSLSRPVTHDLLNFVFSGFDINVLRVVISDYKDNVFYTRLFLQQKQGDFLYITDIDARPSDSIPLALTHQVPILCVKSVFDNVVPYQE